ncbi:hypothetical protein P167DRAFT_566541 [Morchella conica CCBAS932]|uniref:Uncharacterized protein n=1 Tax=Morchella conica CCBAS932 TaxID=1392247 RepID=A0A3N4KIG1_9PEZI|nr:hypothetical protein P167DRAFT_566541 [Morchella conica CCBAS932]
MTTTEPFRSAPAAPVSSSEAPPVATPSTMEAAPPAPPAAAESSVEAPPAARPRCMEVRSCPPNPTLYLSKPAAYNLVVELDDATSDASANSPTSDCPECPCVGNGGLFDNVKEGFRDLGQRLEWLESELALAVQEQREMEVRFREVVELVERVVNGGFGLVLVWDMDVVTVESDVLLRSKAPYRGVLERFRCHR